MNDEQLEQLKELLLSAYINIGNVNRVGFSLLPLIKIQLIDALAVIGVTREELKNYE